MNLRSTAVQALSRQFPRGLLGPVRADSEPKRIIGELLTAFEEFKAKNDERLANAQAGIDDLSRKIADATMRPGSGADNLPTDPSYSKLFASWMRRGQGEHDLDGANAQGDRARIRAAMSTGSSGDGGYLAPIEWDRQISKALLSVSPLRQLCTVQTTTIGGYSTVWSDNAWGSGWVGETAGRPSTSTPNLKSLEFTTGELYANPAVTQQLIEDAAFDVVTWLATELSDEFSRQEAIAFVGGDGANKPRGFLSYIGKGTTWHPGGEPGVVMSGSAAAVAGDGLVDLVFSVPGPYRQGAAWLMSSYTIGAVRKLKDGMGNYLWQPSYIVGLPPTLLGYPVYVDENMPNIEAGALPIAFGNWRRFYVINDRLGTSVLRDPYTNKPYVQFYTRKRVGGGILDPKAVNFLEIGTA